MITQEQLKLRLTYDPDTGTFTNNVAHQAKKVGSVAGRINHDGYVQIMVHGKRYLGHRLAWLYVNGNFPESQIDHINRNKSDNRIANLRLADFKTNGQNKPVPKNNTSGIKGVCWNKNAGKWQAQIKINKKVTYLGLFKSENAAAEAYKTASLKHHTHSIFLEQK